MEKRILILVIILFASLAFGQRIDNIDFYGNENIATGELEELISSETNEPYQQKIAELDQRLIHNFYLSRGYLHNEVLTDTVIIYHKLHLVFSINEGNLIKVGKVRIDGNIPLDSEKLLREFGGDGDSPFTETIVSTFTSYIGQKLADIGYPYSNISGSYQIGENNRADIDLYVFSGPLIEVASINYYGLDEVIPDIAKRETTFKVGDIFSNKEINETQNNLYNTSLFDYVGIRYALVDTSDSQFVHINYYFREIDPMYIELGMGIAYEENVPYNLSLSPGVKLGHNNLWGVGRRASISYQTEYAFSSKLSEFDNTENLVRLQYVEPKIFATRFDMTANLQYQERRGIDRIDYNNTLLQFLTHYKVKETYVDAGISMQKVNALESGSLDSLIIEDTGNQDFIFSVWTILSKDSRKSFVNPLDAAITSLNIKYAYSIPLETDSTRSSLKNSQYITLRGFWNRYQPFTKYKTLIYASRLSPGLILSFGESDFIPVTERLYLGGSNSIRGIAEQTAGDVSFNVVNGEVIPIGNGGKISFLFNNELRWKALDWGAVSLGFEAFVDFGYVWPDFDQIDLTKYNAGTGLGVLLITPLGALRFDYAMNLNQRSWDIEDQGTSYHYEEPKWVLHFGINFAF